MTLSEFVSACYLRSTGKATAPSTSKRSKILGLASFYINQYAREVGVDWNSLYDPNFSIGNVTATDTYDLDTTSVRKLSNREGDTVRIVWSDGVGFSLYDIVNADTLKDYYYSNEKESYSGRVCAQIGSTLVFNHKFTSDDSEFGGEILVPVYAYPEQPVNDDDEIPCNDPNWLVLRCAAEYVRTDITRQGQYSNLLSEANEAMQRMISDNYGQIDKVNMPWTPFSGTRGSDAW